MPRPIITLTTDFGLTDYYVAAMKAVLLKHCSTATIIDVTHNIARQDILAGSITLERALASFPRGTVHLAVIDPGVGTDRRLLIARLNGSLIVCPDNGLVTWAVRRNRSAAFYEITWKPPSASNTFHGRDLLAPITARLAAGAMLKNLSRRISDPMLLNVDLAQRSTGQILHIDHFGNATTNISAEHLQSIRHKSIRVGRQNLNPLHRTYEDISPGKPLALIGSSDLLEIAVRNGSAAKKLKLQVGDEIQIQ